MVLQCKNWLFVLAHSADSFLSFPSWISRTGAVLSLSLKTISSDSVLLYNTGNINSNDFVAMELNKGRLRQADTNSLSFHIYLALSTNVTHIYALGVAYLVLAVSNIHPS